MDIIEYFPKPFSVFDMVVIIFTTILIATPIIILVIKLFKKPKKSNLELLKELNIGTKESLFEFTKIAQKIDNSPKLKELLKELEEYKFNPNSKELPSSLQDKIKRYIDEL